jgi:transmembrane sensor
LVVTGTEQPVKNHPSYLGDEILMKYLTGGLTAGESGELKKQLDADPEGRAYLEQMEKIWKLSAGIGDFQSIDAEGDWNTWRERIGPAPADRPEPGQLRAGSPANFILRIAAVFLLAAGTAFTIYYFAAEGPLSRKAWITVSAGEQVREISLPDGSTASLNTGGSLRYPSKFKGNKRSVRLEGEAFFEIARDEQKPFTVNASGDACVEVLGTSFDLRSDSENNKVFLNVVSGRVAFYPRGKKRRSRELGPDEQAVCEKGSISQPVTVDLNFLSWKSHILVFENTPLKDVLDQLGRYYRKDFRMIGGGLESLALTGTYERQPMEDVLEEIAMVLDVDFRQENGTIRVSANENTNPSGGPDAE